ncbi:hypothetical protein [Blastopirellula marina]|uniref:Uncharacterized protein n=1 Tax=Blastopirellula marina TaxID=124 RepID=A0A2S8GPA4_9BACT|nr:hypothetical protein [Blastopirellula marina]PQO46252.1 hypothetical protein C5Y93_09710 [Blastopirellula marina]
MNALALPFRLATLLLIGLTWTSTTTAQEQAAPLKITWKNKMLQISGDDLPGKTLDVWYIEAYCRPGSTNRDWNKTVIEHTSKLVRQAEDGSLVELRDELEDGVIIEHRITAGKDVVTFDITAHNPTKVASDVDWGQPCVRVDRFTATNPEKRLDLVPPYAKKCFIFVDGKPVRLPTKPWATEAIYTPGQVYAAKGVSRDDVNPRPLSEIVPSNHLMACFSGDEKQLLGVAFEPCQELFQGVITCIHSDFRIGGLAPGESKQIRGKIYLISGDPTELERRYREDFQ